jgi:hypothetical protein
MNDDMMEDMEQILDDVKPNEANSQLSSYLLDDPPTNNSIFIKVLKLACMTQLTLPSESCKSFIIQMQSVQTRALACLTNLFLTGIASPWIAENQEKIPQLWHELFNVALQLATMDPTPFELFEGVIVCTWAFICCVQATGTVIVPDEQQVQWMLQSASLSSLASESLKGKFIGIISYFARLPGRISLNKVIFSLTPANRRMVIFATSACHPNSWPGAGQLHYRVAERCV